MPNPDPDFKDMDNIFTLKTFVGSSNLEHWFTKTRDYIHILTMVGNPNQEPPASSKASIGISRTWVLFAP